MTAEAKIKKSFERVKTRFRRWPLDGPDILDKGTAQLDILKRKVAINPKFAEELATAGEKDLETILNGLFEHEFGHYLYPGNLAMAIFLSNACEKHYKSIAGDLYASFIDIIDNGLVYGNKFSDDLKQTLESHFKLLETNDKLSPPSAAIFLAYKEMMGLDIDIDISVFKNSEDIKKAAEEIKNLVFTPKEDYGIQSAQIFRYGDAMKPLFVGSKGQGGGTAEALDSGNMIGEGEGSGLIDKESLKNLDSESMRAIEEAMQELAKKLPRDMYEDIEKSLGLEKVEPGQGSGSGIGRGGAETGLANKKTIEYYKTLARGHGIYIRPKRGLTIDKSEMPMVVGNFTPSKPVNKAIFTHSGGRIIPGLTKVIENTDIPHISEKERTPNVIIYKDVSGSMNDPRHTKDYATIAATIIALSYLRSNANVGISLFDDGSDEIFHTKNEDELLALLCGYKGGGTSVDMDKLKNDLKKSGEQNRILNLDEEEIKRDPFLRAYIKKAAKISKLPDAKVETDLFIITDGGIANLGEVLAFLKENPKYRPTIIHTSGYELKIPGYDGKTSGVYEGITVLRAETKEDIINLTKDSLQKTLLARYDLR